MSVQLPDFTAHWYQKNSQLVDSWEFQFLRVGSSEWEWAQRVEPADLCVGCFQASLALPDAAILIRTRAVIGDGRSQWSNEMTTLPEPDFSVGVAMCAIVLIWLAGGRWGGGYRK